MQNKKKTWAYCEQQSNANTL